MAKRQRKKMQKGRFRYRAGERSELKNTNVSGQRYDKDFQKMVAFATVKRPSIGYMSEARQRVFNLRKEEKDKKYVARFKGTPNGVYEIRVRHEEIINGFQDDQWVDLYSSTYVCVKLFWKHGGQAFLVRYEAESMTYRTTELFGNPERAKRAYTDGRVRWNDPLPMIVDG